MPQAAEAHAEKKRSEIFAFLWATAAGLLMLCLWSYTPDDVRFEASTPNFPIRNYAGPAGAYVSWGLFFIFGKSAFFFVVLLGLWALAAWSGGKKHSISFKLFSGTIFFMSACSSLALVAGEAPSGQFQGGGLIGYFLAHLLRELFGQSALYISGTLFVLSVLLATDFLVFPVIAALVRSFRATFMRSMVLENQKQPKPDASKTGARNAAAIKPVPKSPAHEGISVRIKTALSDMDVSTAEGKRPLPDGPPVIKTLIPKNTPAPKQVVEKPAPVPAAASVEVQSEYHLPPLDILRDPVGGGGSVAQDREEIEQQSRVLEETLADFGIDVRVVEVEQGPVITRYELQPASGVKVQRITGLTDNIALALKATSVRVIAPIPGKSRVGIEVPNRATSLVTLKELLVSSKFRNSKSKLAVAIGKDTGGEPVIANLDALPHLLIAGSTGSGKTVCVNTIIASILYNATPQEAKLILIDPKMVELNMYNGLPHLLAPVVTEAEKVTGVLGWLVGEMERRYKVLSGDNVRNIVGYNEKISKTVPPPGEVAKNKLPYIVVVIDELADLMMAAGKEVEAAIMRLAQLSRAVGIHLVLATQRPSVDVITGVIKANFPARISFQVASKVDSRTVLDMNGADALLGKGDLLFLDPAQSKPIRAQGGLVTDDEIERTVAFIKAQRKPEFNDEILKGGAKKKEGTLDFRDDEFYDEACRVIVSGGQASVSMLQRRLGLGYTRAARLVDMMEEDGIVGPHRGSKPREILVDLETLMQRQRTGQGPGMREPAGPSAPQSETGNS